MHDIYWQVVYKTHSFAYLTHILKQMCTQLLEKATLIAQPLIENTYICHQVTEFLAGAIPEGLKLFIDILLKGSERYFEAYQVDSLPFFIQISVGLCV